MKYCFREEMSLEKHMKPVWEGPWSSDFSLRGEQSLLKAPSLSKERREALMALTLNTEMGEAVNV